MDGASGDAEIGEAGFAHAPTSIEPRRFDEDDPAGAEEDEPRAGGLDRRHDVLWWLLTPIVLLVVVPPLTASITFFVAGAQTGYPSICQAAARLNGCEEVVLRMVTRHAWPSWPAG